MVPVRGIIPKPFSGVSRTADMSSLCRQVEREELLSDIWPSSLIRLTVAYYPSSSQLTTGGLNNSLRSVKLDKNLVRSVSMGSSRMMDESDVTLFSNFFRGAAKKEKKQIQKWLKGGKCSPYNWTPSAVELVAIKLTELVCAWTATFKPRGDHLMNAFGNQRNKI